MFDNRQFLTALINSGDYEIDWSNPITQGLKVFFHGGKNIANNTLCTPSSAAVGGAWKYDTYGKYWAVTGDTEYWEVPMTGITRNTGANTTDFYIGNDRAKFTVLAFAQTSSGGAGYNTVVSHTEAGQNGGWYLSSRVYASGGLLGCTQGGAGYVTSNITPSTSKPQVFGCAYGASNADFICDGVLNTGVSNIASYYCTPNRIRIGARNNHNGDGEGLTSGDKLYWVMIWSRRLSVGELQSINNNPMQIIKPRFGGLMKVTSGPATYTDTLTETTSLTDSSSTIITAINPLTETSTATDTLIGGILFASSVDESITPSDDASPTVIAQETASESVTTGESVGSIANFVDTFSNTVSTSESTVTQAVVQSSLSEDTTTTESTSAGYTVSGSVSESASPSEAISNSTLVSEGISEGASSSESLSGSCVLQSTVSETISTADSLSNILQFNASIGESVAASDTSPTQAVFTTASTEAVSAADSLSSSLNGGGVTYSSSIEEVVSNTDLLSETCIFQVSISEAQTSGESLSGSLLFSCILAEGIVASDQEAGTESFSFSFSEETSVSESAEQQLTISRTLSETTSTSDSSTTVGSFSVVISEGLTAASIIVSSVPGAAVMVDSRTVYIPVNDRTVKVRLTHTPPNTFEGD